MRMTDTVKQLLIINIIFYIGSNIVGDTAYQLFSDYYPGNPNFRFWQPLTSVFMHLPVYGSSNPAAIMHLVMNMLGLAMFGSTLEQFWGAKKFLFFYISCGILASLFNSAVSYYYFHHGMNLLVENGQSQAEVLKILAEGKINTNWQNLMPLEDYTKFVTSYFSAGVGASGALYGLLVAFAFMFPMAELFLMFIPVPIKAKYFVPGLILVDIYLGLNGSSIFGAGGTGIGHFAHVGGALSGFLMMWYWKRNQFNKNRWN